MSDFILSKKDISRQIVYMQNNNHNPCHIRDIDCRYVYVNPAMSELLDLSESFSIEGKLISEIPHWTVIFGDEIYEYDKMVMMKKSTFSFLMTSAFGRNNSIQPYIFDIRPFFDNEGNVVGTMAEATPCKFFSALQYVDGESPTTLISHAPDVSFTEKELEIIFFTYNGLTSKETAKRLNISHRTVENRLCNLYQKAHVNNIYQFKEFCRDIDIDCYIPRDFLTPGIKEFE
ncbi:LuxR C-terminal-related transcriptional regulator [Sodalis endosymbiont of Spalangia cameroni]|uniref:helix-turn-helix transcriptional regulator n=1 Tax=Sodalis praecaptivus TaxID=1239307 RepID=UPI0031F82F43